MLNKKTVSLLMGALLSTNIAFSSVLVDEMSHRSPENVVRDQYRKPIETLEFFGIKPTDKVVEILPGGGWYTEILSPMLSEGELIALHYPRNSMSEYRKRSREKYDEKIASNQKVYKNVVIADFDLNGYVSGKAEGADAVLVFRALHGIQRNGELAKAFVQFKEMLKSGGKLAIVQHEAPESYLVEDVAKKGYLPKSHVIAVAKAAGFVLEADSDMHNNPKDTVLEEDLEEGVWSLPPSLSNEEHKERLKKVGESNRMTLLFRLP